MSRATRVVLVAAIALASGCFADRRSSSYACTEQANCKDGRVCLQGFCVLGNGSDDGGNGCPGMCASCDLTAATKTCTIECATAGQCAGAVVCPTGFACTISCSANGACPAVDCSAAKSCDVTCSAKDSCGAVDCGSGACDVTCSTTNACGTIGCKDACKCDVSCGNGGNACTTNMCPDSPASGACRDNAPGFPCDSSLQGCNTCTP